jgi:hypothetical protein
MPPRSTLATLLSLGALACGPALEASVKTNPICDISAVVSWSTDDPASAWVEVSAEGVEPFRVGSDELGTEHEVVVVGMEAGGSYSLEAVSTTEQGRELRSAAAPFDTPALPETFLQGELTEHDPALVAPGWILANVMTGSYGPVIAVMLNERGRVVWYYIHDGDDGGADIQLSWFPQRGSLLVGPHMAGGDRSFEMDLQGQIVWEGPTQPGEPGLFNIQDGQWHHVLFEADDGDIVTVESQYEEVDGEMVQGDRVVQLDRSSGETWSWSTFDHIPYDPGDIYLGLWWTHVNSVTMDLDEDVAYINSWVLGKTWKVDRASGEIIWTLGKGGDFLPPQDHETPWYAFAHSFDPIGDDHFLIYDNGSMERGWSRVVEYALDESTMEAEIVWEYPGDFTHDHWYVTSCGDVDQLDNGNRLVVAHRRIMELTMDGEMAWEYNWIPTDDTDDLRSYQAERIDALALPIP